MFEKKDIIKIIFLGIVVLLLIIITVILTNNEQPQKSNNINKNEIISNIVGNDIEPEEPKTIKYVEYKVNYNLTNEERQQMQKQADQREMEGGFDDSNITKQ